MRPFGIRIRGGRSFPALRCDSPIPHVFAVPDPLRKNLPASFTQVRNPLSGACGTAYLHDFPASRSLGSTEQHFKASALCRFHGVTFSCWSETHPLTGDDGFSAVMHSGLMSKEKTPSHANPNTVGKERPVRGLHSEFLGGAAGGGKGLGRQVRPMVRIVNRTKVFARNSAARCALNSHAMTWREWKLTIYPLRNIATVFVAKGSSDGGFALEVLHDKCRNRWVWVSFGAHAPESI